MLGLLSGALRASGWSGVLEREGREGWLWTASSCSCKPSVAFTGFISFVKTIFGLLRFTLGRRSMQRA